MIILIFWDCTSWWSSPEWHDTDPLTFPLKWALILTPNSIMRSVDRQWITQQYAGFVTCIKYKGPAFSFGHCLSLSSSFPFGKMGMLHQLITQTNRTFVLCDISDTSKRRACWENEKSEAHSRLKEAIWRPVLSFISAKKFTMPYSESESMRLNVYIL